MGRDGSGVRGARVRIFARCGDDQSTLQFAACPFQSPPIRENRCRPAPHGSRQATEAPVAGRYAGWRGNTMSATSIPQKVLDATDITAVTQLILLERECRDLGRWQRMRECFHLDSLIRVSWF